MSKKLAAKASLIQLPEDLTPPVRPTVPSGMAAAQTPTEPRSRTAPGTMAHFMVSQAATNSELEGLRRQLKSFDGSTPARSIDPRRIRSSKWANRHEASFVEEAFVLLKEEIASAGGNVQPIKVRPLPTGSAGEEQYEIVFGHRRHRACLELGLPVLSLVAEVDDQTLFAEMERENRGRKSLSAWEQGMMYRRALDSGLFVSQRKLSEHLGVDISLVSKSLSLARLPDAVISAFSTPLDIQFRWAQPLSEALQRDPEGLVRRATALGARDERFQAKEVFERLTATPEPSMLNRSTPSKTERFGRKGKGASMRIGKDGSVSLEIDAGVINAEQREELRQWIRSAFEKK